MTYIPSQALLPTNKIIVNGSVFAAAVPAVVSLTNPEDVAVINIVCYTVLFLTQDTTIPLHPLNACLAEQLELCLVQDAVACRQLVLGAFEDSRRTTVLD